MDNIHDFRKLKKLKENPKQEGYLLKIEAKTGKYTKDRYCITSGTILVIACIAREDWWKVQQADEEFITSLRTNINLLLLKGIVGGDVPEFISF